MRAKKLASDFYKHDAITVAKNLLGKYIVRQYQGKIRQGKITEVEAYPGPQDKASHAYRGKKTPRNRAEWLLGGHIYIYLVYGMYWQLNISTGLAGKPECVLIRALELTDDKARNVANGPGKLCRYLRLDKSFYAEDLVKSRRIWLEDRGENVKFSEIKATPRIGIDYAGPYWAKRKLRYVLKELLR